MKKTYTLITGASSGIGKELAWLAAKDGHNLIVVARDAKKLQLFADELSMVEVIAIAQDLSEVGAAKKLWKELEKRHLPVDMLINNAGFGDSGPFYESKLDKQSSMVQLNIATLVELTHLLLPNMLKNNYGRIMNVGSVASFIPGPYMSVYYATKAFVLSFSESLYEELQHTGVTVTCLCPGPTKTDFANTAHTGKKHPTQTTSVSPKQVATYGYRALRAGKPIAIYGVSNKLSVFGATRLFPRSIVRKVIARMQKG